MLRRCLLIHLIAFFFLPGMIPILSAQENQKEYQGLIKTYEKWLDLEEETFEKLNFRVSPTQYAKTGYNLKLTLLDDLDRIWIFKPDYEKRLDKAESYLGGERSVVVYRLYKLFGLQTPRIHYITLNINNKMVSGNIQQFIPNQGTLAGYEPYQLNHLALNYLLKSYTVDWLLANYDSSPQNFLVISHNDTGNVDKIMRIDNDSAFYWIGKDELRYDWICPWQRHPYTKYYYKLWNSYVHKKIKLNAENNLVFIKFISEFPDDFIIKLLLPIKTHSFEKISSSEFEILKQKYREDFLFKSLRARKNNLIHDFEVFYRDVSLKRNEEFIIPQSIDSRKIIDSVSQNLIKEIEQLKTEKLKLLTPLVKNSNIQAIFSPEAFLIVKDIYKEYWNGGKENILLKCEEALNKLHLLEAATDNENERKAIMIYTEEIEKIRSGEIPSFKRGEISKLIESVIPK